MTELVTIDRVGDQRQVLISNEIGGDQLHGY